MRHQKEYLDKSMMMDTCKDQSAILF